MLHLLFFTAGPRLKIVASGERSSSGVGADLTDFDVRAPTTEGANIEVESQTGIHSILSSMSSTAVNTVTSFGGRHAE